MRRVLLALALTLSVGAAGAAQAQTADYHPQSFWKTPQSKAYVDLLQESNFLGAAVHCGIVGDAYSIVVGSMVSSQQAQGLYLSARDYWETQQAYIRAAQGHSLSPIPCSQFYDTSTGMTDTVRQQVMSAQAYTFGN